jgi:O-antigen ligase
MYIKQINSSAFYIGIFGCVLLGFAIPTSRPLFNTASLLIIIGWIFSGQFYLKWQVIKNNPLSWPILGILLILIVGATYTSAPIKDVIDHWNRYSKFLLVLMIITMLTEQRYRRWMWISFLIGCSIVLISTYLNIFFLLPWSKTKNLGLGVDHSVFIDYIAQSLVIVLFAVVLWLLALQSNRWQYRLILFMTCLVAVLSVIFLTASRIGYVIILSISLLVPFLSLSNKRLKFISFIIFALILGLLSISDLSISRIESSIIEMQNYKQGEVFTSTGARIHMWATSINLWMQAPLLGHGTGAYHELSKNAFANELMCQIGCFHPHNQFLFFAVDHGLVGVMLLVLYFITACRIAMMRNLSEKTLFLSFICIVFIDALAHGPLWLFMEAYFSYGIMSMLAAGKSGLFEKNTIES